MKELAIFFGALTFGYFLGFLHGGDRATRDAERSSIVREVPRESIFPEALAPRDDACKQIFELVSSTLYDEEVLSRGTEYENHGPGPAPMD